MAGPGEKLEIDILMSVFANTVNTFFSFTFFHLLYKNYGVFNFPKLLGFGDVVTQFYLNFLNFQKLECDTSPLHSWSLLCPW